MSCFENIDPDNVQTIVSFDRFSLSVVEIVSHVKYKYFTIITIVTRRLTM